MLMNSAGFQVCDTQKCKMGHDCAAIKGAAYCVHRTSGPPYMCKSTGTACSLTNPSQKKDCAVCRHLSSAELATLVPQLVQPWPESNGK